MKALEIIMWLAAVAFLCIAAVATYDLYDFARCIARAM